MFQRFMNWIHARTSQDSERGDVPGWVMIVIMTAGLVIILWALAGEALSRVFDTAISRILGV